MKQTYETRFLAAYLECALWSSTDDGDLKLAESYGPEDLAPETMAAMAADCADFIASNAADLGPAAAEQGGHDFWLTRNGNGAGFWDGDWPEDVGRRLTEAAKAYGGVDLYVGDDGRIYC